MTGNPLLLKTGRKWVWTGVANGILLAPAVAFTVLTLNSMARNGVYSNLFLPPVSFRVHAFDLLEMSVFFVVTFLMVRPRGPLANLGVSLSLLFLANAIYELAYGIHRDWTSLQLTVPLTVGAIALLLILNRRLHFLVVNRKRAVPFALGFSLFLASMVLLDQTAFLVGVESRAGGLDVGDPLWVLSKALSEWMLFPLLSIRSIRAILVSLPQLRGPG